MKTKKERIISKISYAVEIRFVVKSAETGKIELLKTGIIENYLIWLTLVVIYIYKLWKQKSIFKTGIHLCYWAPAT